MKIKSFFSSSVEQAIHDARAELGEEAMLITSRPASSESRHLGAYEVVFGTTQVPEQETEAAATDLNAEVTLLRSQMEDIKRVLRLNGAPSARFSQPEIEEFYERLLATGLDAALAREIINEISADWLFSPSRGPATAELLQSNAVDFLRRRLQGAEQASPLDESSRVVIFAGPPGAGKTASLTKIAIQECLRRRKTMRIVSVDPHRPGAHEKLRSFAGVIGASFSAANTVPEFIEALNESRAKDVVLVDTAGYSIRDFEDARDIIAVLDQTPQRETHLVLPASMKREDLIRYVHLYDAFKPDYLLFTKIDETESFGAVICAAIEAHRPLSFFAAGQGIPEDLEPASTESLLASLFGCERAEAITAA